LLLCAGAAAVVLVLAVIFVAISVSPRTRATTAQRNSGTQTSDGTSPANADSDAESNPALESAVVLDAERAVTQNNGLTALEPPSVTRWVEVGRQKRVIPDVMRLHIPAAWFAASSGREENALFVEVEIENLSEAKPLEFHGWLSGREDDPNNQAMLWGDDPQSVVTPLVSADSRGAVRRMAPGEVLAERLAFPVTQADGVETFQIVLPYGPVGLTGHVGFTIPRAFIQIGPPGEESPAVEESSSFAATEASPPADADTIQSEPDAPSKPAADPWSIGELRRQIREDAGAGATGQPTTADQQPRQVGSDTPLSRDTIQDLKADSESDSEKMDE
jgi:hypothetical protein